MVPMGTPTDIYDLFLHGDREKRHCRDTLTFRCLCHLGSNWRLFSHICIGRKDSKPRGTIAEAAVSLPKSCRKRNEWHHPAIPEEGEAEEDVSYTLR